MNSVINLNYTLDSVIVFVYALPVERLFVLLRSM